MAIVTIDWDRERKRKEELLWQKILMYYMYQEYVVKPQQQAEVEMHNAYRSIHAFLTKNGILNRLLQRVGNEPSPAELLMQFAQYETPDSPLGELAREMRKNPPSEEKVAKAIERVVVEEPTRMIEAAAKEKERRTEWQRAHAKEIKNAGDFEIVDPERVRYEQMLQMKMKFLRVVMPPELYKELAHKLETGEYTISPEQLKEQEKQQKQQEKKQQTQKDYETYTKEKRVEPKEKAGKLANAGDVYSAAAYMLAAYEQKDDPEFDEKKADARAMELSGSRAFKAYMKGHPGNLLAAARGTAIKETSEGVTALDADLSRRDAVLSKTRDSLKKMATGRTACFHKMLNALDHFVNEDTEPSKDEKNSLVSALGEYIAKDGSPKSREYDKECFTQAMCSVKALLPDKEFEKVVEHVNEGRDPKVKSADFDLEPTGPELMPDGPTLEPEPVLTLKPSNNND